ncbi:MAG: FAA hydrolase family protein [Rhodobacteraceae bacterium]|nr:MAG: FAA hydrolase family protein [Paracoccaceae bacterium]
MKLMRIRIAGDTRLAMIDEDGGLRDATAVAGDITAATLAAGALDRLALADPAALPVIEADHTILPCVGGVGKFMCIGLNYSDHAAEMGMDLPSHPTLFLKANSAIAGARDDIVMPRGSTRVDWEVELGVVIGKPAKYVDEAQAMEHVAGFCVVNDLSERDFQMNLGGQWTKGKSPDGFGPIGPWLVTRDAVPDPRNLDLSVTVNGRCVQSGNTGTMIFGVAQIVSHLSQLMTLHPGDIIATGTPPGVGVGQNPPVFLKPGDIVETAITGLGVQRMRVRQDA